jgi:glycerol-3-phosphate acyltransferase PlsY
MPNPEIYILLAAVAAYLIGSIPFGLLLTKAKGIDLRAVGSGNIGATNVLRTGNKKLAAATLLLDGVKGYIAVLLGYEIGAEGGYAIVASLFAALAAVIGHVFPLWLKFKGGKGVATSIGVLFGLSPLLGAITCSLWLAVFFCTRISSLSALIGIGASPFVGYLLHDYATALTCLPIKHRENIKRLKDGTEHRFGRKPN